jgi:hypothetical protein
MKVYVVPVDPNTSVEIVANTRNNLPNPHQLDFTVFHNLYPPFHIYRIAEAAFAMQQQSS